MPKDLSGTAYDRAELSPLARLTHHSHNYHDLQPTIHDYDYKLPKLEHDNSPLRPHAHDDADEGTSLSVSSSTKKGPRQSSQTPKGVNGSLARGTACSTCRKRKLVSKPKEPPSTTQLSLVQLG